MKAVSAQAESSCVYVKHQKIDQHICGIIPQLFDCWANPVVHLLLLKSSIAQWIRLRLKFQIQHIHFFILNLNCGL